MKPIKVTDAEIAFGGKISELLPPMEKIPKEFRKGDSKWNKVINDWFYRGLKECQWIPKEGIVANDAVRHVQAIMSSFEPKHEHKEAGCAYLLDLFFEDLKYKTTK